MALLTAKIFKQRIICDQIEPLVNEVEAKYVDARTNVDWIKEEITDNEAELKALHEEIDQVSRKLGDEQKMTD